jgi:hypothetical protein
MNGRTVKYGYRVVVEGGWIKEIKLRKYDDGLHILLRNRTVEPLALSRIGRGQRGRDGVGNLTNVQCKPIQNCHNESLLNMNVS